jgi:hypothetical protein
MMDLDKFDWPWPTTLNDDELVEAIAGLEAAAGYLESTIDSRAKHSLASLTSASVLFVKQYRDNRRAGAPEYQQKRVQ